MIEVDHLPVVDVHSHPFLNRGAVSAEEFTDLTAFGGGTRAYLEQGGVPWSEDVRDELQRGKRNTLYFKRMTWTWRGSSAWSRIDAVLERATRPSLLVTRSTSRSYMKTPASTP